jgi:hypothetical protein
VPAPAPKDLRGRDLANQRVPSIRGRCVSRRSFPRSNDPHMGWFNPHADPKGSTFVDEKLCHYHLFEFALACVCVTNRRIVKDPSHAGPTPREPGHRPGGDAASPRDLHRPAPGRGAEQTRRPGNGNHPSPASRVFDRSSASRGHTVRVGPARGAGVGDRVRDGPMSSHNPAPGWKNGSSGLACTPAWMKIFQVSLERR